MNAGLSLLQEKSRVDRYSGLIIKMQSHRYPPEKKTCPCRVAITNTSNMTRSTWRVPRLGNFSDFASPAGH